MTDAPLVNDNRRFAITVGVLVVCGVIVAVVSGLAMQKALTAERTSNKALQLQVVLKQEELERSQANAVAGLVAACESRDKSRADTRIVFLALLDIASQGRPETAAGAAFRAFVDEAYDSINCEYGTPGFNTDLDPPQPPPTVGGA